MNFLTLPLQRRLISGQSISANNDSRVSNLAKSDKNRTNVTAVQRPGPRSAGVGFPERVARTFKRPPHERAPALLGGQHDGHQENSAPRPNGLVQHSISTTADSGAVGLLKQPLLQLISTHALFNAQQPERCAAASPSRLSTWRQGTHLCYCMLQCWGA